MPNQTPNTQNLLAQANALRVADQENSAALECLSDPSEVTANHSTLKPFFGENLECVLSIWRQIEPKDGDPPEREYINLVSELAFDTAFRFNRDSSIANMSDMLEIVERWVELCRMANLSACTALQFLADARRSQYCLDTSELTQLERAVILYEEVTKCYPTCAGKSLATLRNYQYCTEELWQRTGDSKYAKLHVEVCRQVVNTCPIDHSDRINLLWKEGNAYMALWQALHENSASEQAVATLRSALLAYSSDDQPDVMLVHDLAAALCTHGGNTYDMDMLRQSETIYRHTMGEISRLGPDLPNSRYAALTLADTYNSLACVLYGMYTLSGDTAHADEALDLYEQAIKNNADMNSQVMMMTNMAGCLHMRYETHNDVASLDEALRIHKKVETLCPPDSLLLRDHDFRGSLMYQHLYACRRHVEDIDMSNNLGERHVAVLPLDHAGRWNKVDLLALGYYNKYLATGDIGSLGRARDLRIDAQSHGSEGDGREVLSLAYGIIGRTRPVSLENLPKAIALQEEVIKKTSYTHAAYTWILINLACDMGLLFEKSGNSAYIEDALHMCDEHMIRLSSLHRDFKASVSPVAALDTAKLRATLCYLYLCRSENHPRQPLITSALSCLFSIVTDTRLTPRARVHDAKALLDRLDMALAVVPGQLASESSQIAELYGQIIELLPHLSAWILDHAVQLDELREAEDLGTHGAIHAIHAGSPQKALRLLEQARGVFWAQTFRLQDPQLQELPSPIQLELKSALQQLRTVDGGTSPAGDVATYNSVTIDRVRQGARIEQLLDEARKLPGMDGLFRNPVARNADFAYIASDGPVVTLISKDDVAYALVLPCTNAELRAVELPKVDEEALRRWIQHTGAATLPRGSSRRREQDSGVPISGSFEDAMRAMKIARSQHRELMFLAVLAEIWEYVALPVINTLGLKQQGSQLRPRLFWCPTGGFTSLPLHAAGVYNGSNSVCCSDYMVSSYTPTLTALDEGRRFPIHLARDDLRTLLVAEPNAPGYELLSGVQHEVSLVRQIIGETAGSHTAPVLGASSTRHSSVTRQQVLENLSSANVLHLACHGIQDATAPLKSGFALHDGLLTIEKLLKLELTSSPRFLAYLSACETAKGDHNQPDQIIHLAAAMLYSGFRNVIATMWTMGDVDGPAVAKIFYEELIRHHTLTSASVAYALDIAVNHLRDQGLPPSRWATFVHIGS